MTNKPSQQTWEWALMVNALMEGPPPAAARAAIGECLSGLRAAGHADPVLIMLLREWAETLASQPAPKRSRGRPRGQKKESAIDIMEAMVAYSVVLRQKNWTRLAAQLHKHHQHRWGSSPAAVRQRIKLAMPAYSNAQPAIAKFTVQKLQRELSYIVALLRGA